MVVGSAILIPIAARRAWSLGKVGLAGMETHRILAVGFASPSDAHVRMCAPRSDMAELNPQKAAILGRRVMSGPVGSPRADSADSADST